MPLIRRSKTERLIAASRTNGRQSNAVRGGSPNLRHGIFAEVDPSITHELGEDPSEYTELREGLLKSLAPQDTMEQAIGEQMVNLLWRQRRLQGRGWPAS